MDHMMRYTVLIFSGAAVLALEWLAWRIMAPYLGVGLDIWTGILSITQVALALVDWAGGRRAHAFTRPICARRSRAGAAATM